LPTSDGVRVDFVAGADFVARLRHRVSELANRHNARLVAAATLPGSARLLTDVRSTAASAGSPGGASLVLKPLDAGDLATLQDSVVRRVRALGAADLGSCPL
jgi:hypothetical protein